MKSTKFIDFIIRCCLNFQCQISSPISCNSAETLFLLQNQITGLFEKVEGLSGMLRGPDKFYVAGYERFKGAGDSPRDSSPEKKKPKYSRDTLATNRLSTDRQEEHREPVSKTSKYYIFRD